MMPGDVDPLPRLRELDARGQERFVLESATDIPTEQLVSALAELGDDLGRPAEIQLTDVVADRGELDVVAHVLLDLPVGVGSDRLATVLVRMAEAHPSLGTPILRTLASTVERMLAAGADTWGAGVLLGAMAEAAAGGDPGAEAEAAARRYLDVAAGEERPYTPGLNSARSLLAASADR